MTIPSWWHNSAHVDVSPQRLLASILSRHIWTETFDHVFKPGNSCHHFTSSPLIMYPLPPAPQKKMNFTIYSQKLGVLGTSEIPKKVKQLPFARETQGGKLLFLLPRNDLEHFPRKNQHYYTLESIGGAFLLHNIMNCFDLLTFGYWHGGEAPSGNNLISTHSSTHGRRGILLPVVFSNEGARTNYLDTVSK